MHTYMPLDMCNKCKTFQVIRVCLYHIEVFYSMEIESASNDNRTMFRIANNLLGRKCMNLLTNDDSGPDAVADRFAYHFDDMIYSLRSQIQRPSANVDNAQPCVISSPVLAFQPASLKEVTALIENGKTKSLRLIH